MRRQIGASILAGAAILAGGCQSSWGGSLWPRATANPASAAAAAPNQQRFGGLAADRPPASGATGLGGAASAPSEPFLLASWKKTTAALTGSTTAAKTTLPEDDPLRLDRVPKKIGPEVYVGAARLLENQGKFDEAEAKYREALKVAPRDFSALIGLARLYDRQGQGSKALEVYRSAAKAHPDNPLVFNDLGLCYRRQRQSGPAIDAFRKAIALKPEEPKYRNNLAAALVEAGRVDEALQQLLAVHSAAAAHYNLAYLLHQQGDRQAALDHLHQALQHDPALAPARQMLAQLGQDAGASSELTNLPSAASPSAASFPGSPPSGAKNATIPWTTPLADPPPGDYAAPAGQMPAVATPVAVPSSPPQLPVGEYGPGPDHDLDHASVPALPATPAAVPRADLPAAVNLPAGADTQPIPAVQPMPPAAEDATQPLPVIQQPAPASYHIGDEGPIPVEVPSPARYSSAAWVFPSSGSGSNSPPAFSQRPLRPAGQPLPPVD